MDRRWPIGRLALCAVVVAASFLPWGTIGRGAGFDLGEARIDLTLPGEAVNAWTSHVGGESFRAPNWLVPAIAGVVALLVAVRAVGLVRSAGRLVVLLILAAGVQSAWMALGLLTGERDRLGIGLVVTLVALAALLVAEWREPALQAT